MERPSPHAEGSWFPRSLGVSSVRALPSGLSANRLSSALAKMKPPFSVQENRPTVPRSIQPQEMGRVVAVPQVGGLHRRYERRAA